MKKPDQEQVWDNIAEEWHEFKTNPSENATNFIDNSKGKILDFGSGSGRNLLKVKKTKDKEIYLVDFSQKMLDFALERAKKLKLKINITKSNLEKIPFKNNFFDATICVAAIHCIPGRKQRENSFKEIYRTLKKGAKADIEVWDKNSERFKKASKQKFINWRDKGKRFYYLYEEQELRKLLEKIGFKIIKKIPHKANLIFIIEK